MYQRLEFGGGKRKKNKQIHKFVLFSTVSKYMLDVYLVYFNGRKGVILNAFMLGVQWLFNAFRHICGNICILKFELLRLFKHPPYPEGIKDIQVWLYDSWLDCRDKRVQINLLSSKWVSVTEEIKGFWSASQMTDAAALLPPQWPADKPRPRERATATHTQACTQHAHTHNAWCHWGLFFGFFFQWHAFSGLACCSWKNINYKIEQIENIKSNINIKLLFDICSQMD